MELSYAAGTANITDTNWKREHITDYPCNRIFARMNHTCNGVRVSSCDSPSTYVDGWIDAHQRQGSLARHAGLFNKEPFVSHGIAHGTTRTSIFAAFRPHMSLWDLPYGLVSGSNVLQLFPLAANKFPGQLFTEADLNAADIDARRDRWDVASERFLAVGNRNGSGIVPATATAACLTLSDEAYHAAATALATPGNAANPTIAIESIKLYACFATPQVPQVLSPLMTHRLTTPNIQEYAVGTTTVNQTFQDPASTFFVQVWHYLATDDFTASNGAMPCHNLAGGTTGCRLKDLSVRYGGQTYPTCPYAQLDTLASSDLSRAYADSCNARVRLDSDLDVPKSLEGFTRAPVFGFNIYKTAGDTSTALTVRATYSANVANTRLVLCCYSNELLGITYRENEPVRIDVQPVV